MEGIAASIMSRIIQANTANLGFDESSVRFGIIIRHANNSIANSPSKRSTSTVTTASVFL